MKQIFLVLKREYMVRVKKRSFLLATILTPLLFPALIFGVIYLSNRDSGGEKEVFVFDESGLYQERLSSSAFSYTFINGGTKEEAIQQYLDQDGHGILLIPEIDLSDPTNTRYSGFEFRSKTNLGINEEGSIKRQLRKVIEDIKLERSGLDPEVLNSLKAQIDFETLSQSEGGEAKKSNSGISLAVGYVTGFLIYMFIFVYGSQIMQSVLDEKTSRIVEVIVSSVRPFQLMMGKVLGVGSVGFTQLLIWIALMATLTTVGFNFLGAPAEQMAGNLPPEAMELTDTQEAVANVQEALSTLPIVKIVVSFLFYFLGAYFLYGALYAAVGSAVDSIQDAQQFMFPIILPIIVAIIALMQVIQDPNSTLAVWLSLIPLTSPIVMMARLPFGVPDWQLALSMVLLIFGFIGTIWVAGRIYRVGILMYGVKVNWKTLKVWFTMKV